MPKIKNDRQTFRIYPDGTVVHEDDFNDDDPQVYDDYEEISIPDDLVDYLTDIPMAY